MRVFDGPVGGRTEKEKNERDILIEHAIMELRRNLVSGKLPGIQEDNAN